MKKYRFGSRRALAGRELGRVGRARPLGTVRTPCGRYRAHQEANAAICRSLSCRSLLLSGGHVGHLVGSGGTQSRPEIDVFHLGKREEPLVVDNRSSPESLKLAFGLPDVAGI